MRKRLAALWHHLKTENSSPSRLAASVFLGLFLGVVPLYGVQTPICIGVAWLLGLNRLTVVGAAQISLPPFAPFLVAAGIAIGDLVRFGELRAPDLGQARGFLDGLALLGGEVPDLFLSCLIGDTLLGLVLGALGAVVAYRVASARLAGVVDETSVSS
jgi:uncharacterized protein (DUF2062 family)